MDALKPKSLTCANLGMDFQSFFFCGSAHIGRAYQISCSSVKLAFGAAFSNSIHRVEFCILWRIIRICCQALLFLWLLSNTYQSNEPPNLTDQSFRRHLHLMRTHLGKRRKLCRRCWTGTYWRLPTASWRWPNRWPASPCRRTPAAAPELRRRCCSCSASASRHCASPPTTWCDQSGHRQREESGFRGRASPGAIGGNVRHRERILADFYLSENCK